jgi:hypothetical protein
VDLDGFLDGDQSLLAAPQSAQPVGLVQSRAAAWVRMAGATYGDYVALRLAD